MKTEEERKDEHFTKYEIYKLVLIVTQVLTFFLNLIETINGEYRIQLHNIINWIRWVLILLLLVIGNMIKQPVFFKIGFHIQFISMILLVFDVTNKRFLDNVQEIIMISQPMMIGMFCPFFLPMCFIEHVCVHIPLSILYQIACSFGFFSMFYG